MIPPALRQLPPGGSAIGFGPLRRALLERAPGDVLCTALQRLTTMDRVSLYASGREALRAALVSLAERSGRREVVLPAYTCFSLPSAVVAAGLRVRLVDVDARGWIDPTALAALPLERAACVVVSNLFGIPEPIEPVLGLAGSAGVAVLDDAAQALGARDASGPVGGRGDLGLLSFGRGKPLQGLGGGALVERGDRGAPQAPPPRLAPRRSATLLRALLWDAALSDLVFPWLAAVPALGVGESVFDPGFRRGGIDSAALALAASQVGDLLEQGPRRANVAEHLAEAVRRESSFAPLLADPGARAVYPRLAILAPDPAARDSALHALERLGAGASPLYPSALDRVPALAPHREGSAACPGARDFQARLLTLPTHGRLGGARLARCLEALGAAAARRSAADTGGPQ